MSDYLPPMFQQDGKEFIFDGGQVNFVLATEDYPPFKIHPDFSNRIEGLLLVFFSRQGFT